MSLALCVSWRSLQVIGSKQMSFESSFERTRRLNVTDFTRGGIPDSGGSIRKRTFSQCTCSDVGYAQNSWINLHKYMRDSHVGSAGRVQSMMPRGSQRWREGVLGANVMLVCSYHTHLTVKGKAASPSSAN